MKNKLVIGYATNRSKAFQETFNQALLESVGLSDDEVSIISFENDGSLSLTATYNSLWKQAAVVENAVFAFIHHDIYFKSNGWGRILLDLFNHNSIDIVGVVGSDVLHEHCVWLLDRNVQLTGLNLWGKVWHNTHGIEKLSDYTAYAKSNAHCATLQPVVVIDGVFIAFDPTTCSKFDEDFDNFHFYDISFCINNYLQGKRIAVTETIQLCHESEGGFTETWQKNRLKFYEKYSSYLPLSI